MLITHTIIDLHIGRIDRKRSLPAALALASSSLRRSTFSAFRIPLTCITCITLSQYRGLCTLALERSEVSRGKGLVSAETRSI
jgi:hypothetical protein